MHRNTFVRRSASQKARSVAFENYYMRWLCWAPPPPLPLPPVRGLPQFVHPHYDARLRSVYPLAFAIARFASRMRAVLARFVRWLAFARLQSRASNHVAALLRYCDSPHRSFADARRICRASRGYPRLWFHFRLVPFGGFPVPC